MVFHNYPKLVFMLAETSLTVGKYHQKFFATTSPMRMTVRTTLSIWVDREIVTTMHCPLEKGGNV